ncbi:sulfurtransferase [Lysinibacter cavernae]|uniref:Thiosulfate/3-mercaptopyruvate sulfurtransferase n=1 Tax=Lysinibacter cavernae TaxID=1640652 RepID=A0A7X5R3G4_9MICO|nr:rhodanese-like domain-containing protein [Lysinibacter cavernae]NIH54975.1 thiosulfate/3-mercaptopyruvate sulfurtransferase [Lysinibacter cavernae]
MSSILPEKPDSPIVSAQWVYDHLGSEDIILVDASAFLVDTPDGKYAYVSGDEEFMVGGHLPGAVFADLINEFSDPSTGVPFSKPDVQRFADAAGAIGADNEKTIIVYDSSFGHFAARLWWLFRAFGYDRVVVLDGGLKAWNANEFPLEYGHVEPDPCSFTADERPELWVDKAFVEGIVAGTEQASLVCGLPPKEFTGAVNPRVRGGHIPGSVSAPVVRLLDKATNTFLGREALADRLGEATTADRVVVYCGAGIAAAADALALTLIGHKNVALYDGSLIEWAADPGAPLVTTS